MTTAMVAAGPLLAQELLQPPPTSEQPATGEPTQVLKPRPDTHGRADQGDMQQHGTDTASPGGSAGGAEVQGTGSSAGTSSTTTATPEAATPAGEPFEGQALAPQSEGGTTTGQ